MAAVNRVSALSAARPYIPLMAPPDGAISAADRALLGHGYAGILARHPLAHALFSYAIVIIRWAAMLISRQAAIMIAPRPLLTGAAMPISRQAAIMIAPRPVLKVISR